MKKNLSLIIAITACNIHLAANIKPTNYTQLLPEYNNFKQVCKYNSLIACDELNNHFKQAAEHNKQSLAIFGLKLKINDIKRNPSLLSIANEQLLPKLEDQRNELIKNCPNHDKKYFDALSLEQKETLKITLESLMNQFDRENLKLNFTDIKEVEDLFNRIK